jgi:hypothetical protein
VFVLRTIKEESLQQRIKEVIPAQKTDRLRGFSELIARHGYFTIMF